MGIKGTVRRSTDGHFIHCNIDTDVIVSEEAPYNSKYQLLGPQRIYGSTMKVKAKTHSLDNGQYLGTRKPEEFYHIVEHFCLGTRRLELFGEVCNLFFVFFTRLFIQLINNIIDEGP